MVYEELILETGEVIVDTWYKTLVQALNDIIAGSISKLSQLTIDVSKDWAGYVIKNLGAPTVAGDVYSMGHSIAIADIPRMDLPHLPRGTANYFLRGQGTGADLIFDTLTANDIVSGRFGKSRLEWTNGKLLLGAGTGADPTEIDPPVSFIDFWSDPQVSVSITATAGDKTLPDVVVAGLPSGITLVRVVCMLKMRALENTHTSTTNKLNGNQYVQVKESVSGSYTNCIKLVDDSWTIIPSTREGGDLIIGNIDVKTQVTGNATYNFKIANAQADANNLNLNDVQVGIRIVFR
jgi:hypothetical protein